MSVKRFDQFEQNIKDALNQIQPQADEHVWNGIQSELKAGSASGFNWKLAGFVSGFAALTVAVSIWFISGDEQAVLPENNPQVVESKKETKKVENPEKSEPGMNMDNSEEFPKESVTSSTQTTALSSLNSTKNQITETAKTETSLSNQELSSNQPSEKLQEGASANQQSMDIAVSDNLVQSQFELSVSELCEGAIIECHTLTGKSAIWDMGDGNKLEGYRVMYRYLRPGNFTVQAFEQSADGTQRSIGEPVSVRVHSKPDPSFDVIPVSDFGGAETKFIAKINSGQHYWRFGNGETGEGAKSELRYRNKGFYQVKHILISEEGCADSTVSNIRVSKGYNLLAQTVFNPGQGTWLPEGLKEPGLIFELKVYDLNGGIAFTSQSPDQAWDGSSQSGKVAREGEMFYWVAIVRDTEGKSEEYGGNILIISR